MIRRRMSSLVFVLLLAALLPLPMWAAEEVAVEEGITYCQVGDRELQLDLARPEGDGPHPALVFVHGGGWRGGNRGSYAAAIREAAKRGYVAVTVTYRLTEAGEGAAKHPFPAQVYDVKCAVRWLRANAEKYNIDPQRIGAAGGSAGGHLSLMLGLTDAQAKLEGEGGHADHSSQVQAVVNYFGPTDLARLHETSRGAAPIVASFLGGTPEDKADIYKRASPLTYVSQDDPPILTIHGTDDALVPPEQAELLDAALKKAGVEHQLLLLAGQGHGFRGDAAKQASEAMFAFFDKHLKP